MAFNNGHLYLASTGNQLVDVNLSNTSDTVAVGGFGVSTVFGLATGGDENVLYTAANTTIYTIDTDGSRGKSSYFWLQRSRERRRTVFYF